MSELDEFLSWCASASGSDRKDRFGRSMKDARFPYGEVSWWISEFRRRNQ